jgi:flagellar basal body-associated protein FliL
MSNRLLALIILGVIVLGIIGMYVYLFVFYSSSLNFSSNQAGYNIQLVAKKLKTPVNYSCKQKECSYDDIAPLDYQVIISKEGFEDYQGNISVKRSSEQNIVFELEKKTELSTIEEEVVSLKDAVREKRTRLKYKKFYTYYDFGDSGVFYFRKYLGKLFLYRDLGEKEQLIYDFQMLDVSDLHIGEVYNSSYFVISAGTKNYLFNHKNSNFSSLDIQKKIHYGKKSHETNKLLLVTDL